MKFKEFEEYLNKVIEGKNVELYSSKYAFKCRYDLFLIEGSIDDYNYLFDGIKDHVEIVEKDEIVDGIYNRIKFDFFIHDDLDYINSYIKEYSYKFISFKELDKGIKDIVSKEFCSIERYAYEEYGKYHFRINRNNQKEINELMSYLLQYGRVERTVEFSNNECKERLYFVKEYMDYEDYDSMWNYRFIVPIKKVIVL